MPDWSEAIVPLAKIQRYLLSETHRTGKSKAAFFRSYGFDVRRPQELAHELKNLAKRYPVSEEIVSEYGTKYVIDGIMLTPSCDAVGVRTVWVVNRGGSYPRFITAYPI